MVQIKNCVVKLFLMYVHPSKQSSRSYGGPSSIAPLHISTFLSCEPKPGEANNYRILQDGKPKPSPTNATTAQRRYPKTPGTDDPTHHPLELLEDGEVRAAVGAGSGGAAAGRMVGSARRYWALVAVVAIIAGCRGASRSRPRNPAGGRPTDRATRSQAHAGGRSGTDARGEE